MKYKNQRYAWEKPSGDSRLLVFTPISIFYHIIRLLNCYKNIYGLRRCSIENSSKLAISHLF